MSNVDLAKVLELHEEATRRRELKRCKGDEGSDCILVNEHNGPHRPKASTSFRADAFSSEAAVIDYAYHQYVADRADLYAAVVELVPAMVEEIERLRLHEGMRDVAGDLVRHDTAHAIATWLEGYGSEPVNAHLAAKAIRDGKWKP